MELWESELLRRQLVRWVLSMDSFREQPVLHANPTQLGEFDHISPKSSNMSETFNTLVYVKGKQLPQPSQPLFWQYYICKYFSLLCFALWIEIWHFMRPHQTLHPHLKSAKPSHSSFEDSATCFVSQRRALAFWGRCQSVLDEGKICGDRHQDEQ